jgi:uncharacterized lipoprotein
VFSSRRVEALVVTLLAAVLSGCGSDPTGNDADSDAEKAKEIQAASGPVCPSEAQAVDLPASAEAARVPDGAIVYDVEERQGTGTIVNAVIVDELQTVVDELNALYQQDGYTIIDGTNEKGDAEASWESADASGRWTVQDISAACPATSATSVTVFVTEAG